MSFIIVESEERSWSSNFIFEMTNKEPRSKLYDGYKYRPNETGAGQNVPNGWSGECHVQLVIIMMIII